MINLIFGICLILTSLIIIIFPPKFGKRILSLRTKQTLRKEETWSYGQKLFSIALTVIGIIYLILAFFDFPRGGQFFGVIFVLIALIAYKLSIFIIDKIILKKFFDNSESENKRF